MVLIRPEGLLIIGFPHACRGIVLVIGAYFDYSEKEDSGRGFASVGGYAALVPEWEAFTSRWVEIVLRPNQISAFHMADCENGFGEFSGPDWPKERRHALIKTAIGIVCDHVAYGLVQSVVLEDIPAIQEIARLQEKPAHFENAYTIVAPEIFAFLYEDLDRVPGFQDQPVALYFDRETKGAGLLTDCFNEHIMEHGQQARFTSITVADRVTCIPLQAADIAAYEATKHLYNEAHDSGRKVRASYEALQSFGRLRFGVWRVKYPDTKRDGNSDL